MLSGPDISHHQTSVDLGAVARGGNAFVILKATEGVGYVDPTLAARRAEAHRQGLAVGMYHFARAGDPAAEAAYFCGVVGPLRANEFVVLDWEVPHPNPPAWAAEWLKIVKGRLASKPWVYVNSSTLRGYDWSKVAIEGHNLWLAKYDYSTAAVPTVPYWPLKAKQYTDRGSCPGISGGVDLNVFYGDHAALTGSLEDDMPTADEVAAAVWGRMIDVFEGIGPAPAEAWIKYTAARARNAELGVQNLPNALWWQTTVKRFDADGNEVLIPALQEVADAKTQILALQAAVAALASAQGMSAADVEAAVAKALRENTVTVDVNVAGGDKPAA